MALETPSSMKALALHAYGAPSTYGIATLPVPQVRSPNEVLIKVHSASINPVDVKMADGATKLMATDRCVMSSIRLHIC